MDKEKELKTIIGAVLVIALLWIWQNYRVINSLKEEKADVETQIEECEYRMEDYQNALEEANNNIEEANSQIDEARGYAWESYEDMGSALENLYTVNMVSEPPKIFGGLPELPELPKLPSLPKLP